MRGYEWRRALGALALSILAFGASVHAQDDDGSVVAAYQLYDQAIQTDNPEDAFIYAELAYDRALKEWGQENIQTGYLAANYAELLVIEKEFSKAIDVYGVCTDVLSGHLPEAAIDLANCHGALGNLNWQEGDDDAARKSFLVVIELIAYAPEDAYMRSLAADAYLLLAVDAVPGTIRLRAPNKDESYRFERTKDYVLTGLPFIVESYGEVSDEVALAYQLLATYYEFARDWPASQEYYKRAHSIYYDRYGSEDERTRNMYGRARYVNYQDADLEWTAVKGDEERDEIRREQKMRFVEGDDCFEDRIDGIWVRSCVIKAPIPSYPSVAGRKGQFGFAEVRYDIMEDGTVENAYVYTSWPKDAWDDILIEAIEDRKYTPPVTENSEPSAMPGRRSWFLFQLMG
ncbi:hypothetical protein GCM10011342_29410 [Aquisalinus flavus]|uniref:TonB C-terminal domain-containing protein n=1 Tax=Aquisalinus flavus TaxID=1526572 RepID=A0A8J2V360_9PROT|nr:energy transducer TonB [Aquisalinus flavus]MBD0428079.1 energy transducer TonB [Aquisalinus flavus]GGD18810.1 hypothetical protein GCM10011342_29410 [Aquisalinus flavus]